MIGNYGQVELIRGVFIIDRLKVNPLYSDPVTSSIIDHLD